jgi:hypothetical protein
LLASTPYKPVASSSGQVGVAGVAVGVDVGVGDGLAVGVAITESVKSRGRYVSEPAFMYGCASDTPCRLNPARMVAAVRDTNNQERGRE